MAESSSADSAGSPVIIKKYANRRLYNTVTSSYVTLDHLARMVRDGVEFTVHDARTGEDITRAVLTQIIVEEEAKGQNLLPIDFLRQLISLYGDSLQGLVPQYLDVTMTSFASNQEQIRKYLSETIGGLLPFGRFEEMSRRNMATFQQAMSMHAPGGPPAGDGSARAAEGGGATLSELKSQLDAMQRQLDQISGIKEK